MSTLANNAVVTCKVSADEKRITCYGCGRTSNNPYDVQFRYCGKCHVFHDMILPEQRKMWLAEHVTFHPSRAFPDPLSEN